LALYGFYLGLFVFIFLFFQIEKNNKFGNFLTIKNLWERYSYFNEHALDGGPGPLGATYGKMMMWFFILSDALTFSGF
jgi:hypothetical protein